MRAAVLHSPGQPLVLEERQDLQAEGAQRVLRVLAAGVCHSDLHMIDGAIGGPLPRVLGHEIAGHLQGAGNVLVYPCWSDGTCEYCRAGACSNCAQRLRSRAGLLTAVSLSSCSFRIPGSCFRWAAWIRSGRLHWPMLVSRPTAR